METNRWTLSDYLRVGLSGFSSGGLMPTFAEGSRKGPSDSLLHWQNGSIEGDI